MILLIPTKQPSDCPALALILASSNRLVKLPISALKLNDSAEDCDFALACFQDWKGEKDVMNMGFDRNL